MAKVGAGKCAECEKDIAAIGDAYECVDCKEGPYCSGECLDRHMIATHDRKVAEVRCCECNLDLTQLAFEVITVGLDDGSELKMCKGCFYAAKMSAYLEEVEAPKSPDYYAKEIYVELYLANDIEYMKLMIDLEVDDGKKAEIFNQLGHHLNKMRQANLPEAEPDGADKP